MEKIIKGNLKIDSKFFDFINNEVIPGTSINLNNFWSNFDNAIQELTPINNQLLKEREEIQKKIDEWHKARKSSVLDDAEYINFLKSISYIVEEKENFQINTSNVDEEIAAIAGPQLVVPVDNARYALNAANARWGSLYDALYGTDVIPGDKGKGYNADRGKQVINYVRNFLDEIVPLNEGSWKEISKIEIENSDLNLIIKNKKHNLKIKKNLLVLMVKKIILDQY